MSILGSKNSFHSIKNYQFLLWIKTFLYYKYTQINLLGCTVHCLTESPPHQVAWKKFYYDVVKFLKEVPQLLVAVNYHHPGVRKV